MYPRSVHVLFVHGVGRHSRLSSLMQAYQSIRSNVRSPEAPSQIEDPIPNWSLEDFRDGASPPHLKLKNKFPGRGLPGEVYFYEINYSQLAGVVRTNHPIDITRLFVSLDLAVAWARVELVAFVQEFERCLACKIPTPEEKAELAELKRNLALAKILQKITGTFVAATMPVLGVPSLLLRNYTQTFVSTFIRFFEDIATFSMDKNGEQLISAHMDQTVKDILASDGFASGSDPHVHGENRFVVVAHSLGTVVSHNYLVRKWKAGDRRVPCDFVTLGSPIGLVSWLWRFLDFPGMRFTTGDTDRDPYFCWSAAKSEAVHARAPLRWINVVNHLDPIATAFPVGCVDLEAAPGVPVPGIDMVHRYIKTGGLQDAATAHTDYLSDNEEDKGVIELLARTAVLRLGDPCELRKERAVSGHWEEMDSDLLRLRIVLMLAGLAAIAAFVGILAFKLKTPGVLALLLLYAWPALTVGGLAFWQRLVYGGPTKRTSEERIDELDGKYLAAVPYIIRRFFERQDMTPTQRLKRVRDKAMAPGPGRLMWLCTLLVSFVPTLLFMLAPLELALLLAGKPLNPLPLIKDNPYAAAGFGLLFIAYVVCFTVSEFIAHWRSVIVKLYP